MGASEWGREIEDDDEDEDDDDFFQYRISDFSPRTLVIGVSLIRMGVTKRDGAVAFGTSQVFIMRKVLTWLSRKVAYGDLDRELYPAMRLPVRFRRYEPRDFYKVMALYHVNAVGRFPKGDDLILAGFLQNQMNGFMVGELEGQVICCSALERMGQGIYTLAYGLVHPHWQGKRIGSTMTLLRIAATAEGNPDVIQYAMIYAVPQAMSFYHRFGFIPAGSWQGGDGKDYLWQSWHIFRKWPAIWEPSSIGVV